MNRIDELRHIKSGPTPDEKPEGLLLPIRAVCAGNAGEIVRRAKEVMTVVLTETEERWPSYDEWRALLPEWFVVTCASERTQEESDRWLQQWRRLSPAEKVRAQKEEKWMLSNWIYWFEPKQKSWWWWDIAIESAEKVTLTVMVEGWPCALESAEWLLRASGAKDTFQEP